MRSRVPFVAAALVLAGLALAVDTGAGDADLEKGIRQAQEGEFEQAIATLRAALPRLKDGPPQDLTRAHVYLGVAHLGLGDAAAARSSFLEALRADRSLRLSAEEYPPRVLRAFEEARSALPPEPPASARQPAPAAAPAAAAPEPPPSAPAATPADRLSPTASATKAAEPAPKKKSSLPLVLVGVGAAAAGGVALAGGGGGGDSTTPASTSPPVTSPPGPTGEVRLVAAFPPAGGTVPLPSDPRAGMTVPEVTFDVVYGADVANAGFEINLWRGSDLCHSTQIAYATRLDSTGTQYRAGSTARYRVGWWTARQPGCGNAYTTDRFEFAWGSMGAPLFVQNLSLGWSFAR
jgi:hypothetical protein